MQAYTTAFTRLRHALAEQLFIASPAWAPVAAKTRLRSRGGRRLAMISSGGVWRVIGLVMTAGSLRRGAGARG
jgi:hypothetical protein